MTLVYEDLCDKGTKERRQKEVPHTAQKNWQAKENLMSNWGPINDWKQPGERRKELCGGDHEHCMFSVCV